MKRRSHVPDSPLPQVDGIDPVRMRLPPDPEGTWPDLGSYLAARYAGTRGEESMARLLRAGRVLGAGGRILGPGDPYEPGAFLWFHRDMPPEPVVPFPIGVVYRDEHLLVADKPHFLATTPRGSHVFQTALARLRVELSPGGAPRIAELRSDPPIVLRRTQVSPGRASSARPSEPEAGVDAGLIRDPAALERLAADDPFPLARAIARSALGRSESRGAHQRVDRPQTDPALDGLHSVVAGGGPASFQAWD